MAAPKKKPLVSKAQQIRNLLAQGVTDPKAVAAGSGATMGQVYAAINKHNSEQQAKQQARDKRKVTSADQISDKDIEMWARAEHRVFKQVHAQIATASKKGVTMAAYWAPEGRVIVKQVK